MTTNTMTWDEAVEVLRELREPYACMSTSHEGEPAGADFGRIVRGLDAAIFALTAAPQQPAAVGVEAVRGAWLAAITLANNICVQESDRENDRDGDTAWIDGTAKCAKRIREYAHPTDAELLEMLDEAGANAAKAALAQQPEAQTCVAHATASNDAEIEALRAEVDALREALKELITWIPSADTYRRLGFDHEAPMRALGAAQAALSKENKA